MNEWNGHIFNQLKHKLNSFIIRNHIRHIIVYVLCKIGYSMRHLCIKPTIKWVMQDMQQSWEYVDILYAVTPVENSFKNSWMLSAR